MNINDNKKVYWKCKACSDEVFSNTKKVMAWCSYGAMGVDGCESYIRIIVDKDNAKLVGK